jgi:hypothetical protein
MTEIPVVLMGETRRIVRDAFVLRVELGDVAFTDNGPVYECPLCDARAFVVRAGRFFCFACAVSGVVEDVA